MKYIPAHKHAHVFPQATAIHFLSRKLLWCDFKYFPSIVLDTTVMHKFKMIQQYFSPVISKENLPPGVYQLAVFEATLSNKSQNRKLN